MKVIDHSPIQPEAKTFDNLKVHLQMIYKFGLSWEDDMKAQEAIIAHLRHLLDNRFTVLRNVILRGLDVPIPLILVGPSGLIVFYANGARGVFRAKNDTWAEMDRSSRRYVPTRKNPISTTLLMTKVVDAYLTHKQQPHPQIIPALAFSNPGTHVDAMRPAARVVLKDGLERFIGSYTQGETVLNANEVQSIIDALVKSQPEAGGQTLTSSEGLTLDQTAAPAAPVPLAAQTVPQKGPFSFLDRLHLTRTQWLVLGAIAVLDVLVLIAFIFVVMFIS